MMPELSPRLKELVAKLDGLGSKPSLANVARALKDVALSADDVQAYIRTSTQTYHRARVIVRDGYEVLVMTWLPGQASAPHDHPGSVCALQVLQGQAAESSYTVASDGFVDLEYETVVMAGQISAGQDAGVHAVNNPLHAGEPLVTVHVYAPPLSEFRRFTPRPAATWKRPRLAAPPTIVIVGGGFSGSMTAAHILRGLSQADLKAKIVLAERRGSVAEGLAYSTLEEAHLLNVPAAKMSAWPDRPSDFADWATQRHPGVKPGDFLPRRWFGEYVRETLHQAEHETAPGVEFFVALDEVRRVTRHPDGGWMVHLGRDTSLRAAAVVLAVGHRPPADPFRHHWEGPRERFIADPWRPYATSAVDPDEPVLILGSGLTAVDTVLSLTQQARNAPIFLLSRNGLLPQAHAKTPSHAMDMGVFVKQWLARKPGIKTLLHEVRRLAREQTSAGGDWRSVIDGLRPHLATMWKALNTNERKRFLTRVRPFWEVHRHRMAPSIADRLSSLVTRGEVVVMTGHVVKATATQRSVRIALRDRGTDRVSESEVKWVINCIGPAPSNSAESNPVIGSLLVHGWVMPDELALGLETTPAGNAIDAKGNAVPDLFVLGTLRKPALWESTAVPELREQAAAVGAHVVSLVREQAHAADRTKPVPIPAISLQKTAA